MLETKEEIGDAISQLQKVSIVFLSPGLMREQVHLYLAAYKNEDKIGRGGGLVSENVEWTALETSFKYDWKSTNYRCKNNAAAISFKKTWIN